MGLTYADITLANALDVGLAQTGRAPKDSVRKIDVKALVDSGAYILTIDESIKTQLGLTVKETREIELADGSRSECEIVGPIYLYFKNHATTCRALVLPGATEVLLGAIPLEDLDVLYYRQLRFPVSASVYPWDSVTLLGGLPCHIVRNF